MANYDFRSWLHMRTVNESRQGGMVQRMEIRSAEISSGIAIGYRLEPASFGVEPHLKESLDVHRVGVHERYWWGPGS